MARALLFGLAALLAGAPMSASAQGAEGDRPVTPAAASRPATPTASGTAEAPRATTPPSHELRLRDLEERVVDLKEKVYRSKSRLTLLREQVLHQAIAEAAAVLVHDNRMGRAFRLEQVVYYLDGERVFFRDNRDGQLAGARQLEVFNGTLTPGNHLVAVELVYKADGGVFTYVDGYTFRVKSSHSFVASKGRITRVAGVGYERGGMTTQLQDKPFVRFDVDQFPYSQQNLEALARGERPADGPLGPEEGVTR